jgi:hypothetical protein
MKTNSESLVRPVRDGQRGQSLLIMAAGLLVVLLAMAALTIDLGEIYFSYQRLLSATNAAALAGGAAMPAGAAQLVAQEYSGQVGPAQFNTSKLNITSVTVNEQCVQPATYPNLGLPPCIVYPNDTLCPNAAGCNLVQVVEKATVPTFFAKIFGVKSVPLKVTATASAKGGQLPAYNIMLVLDATPSMGMGTDTGCTGNGVAVSPENCAQYGIQQLLGELDPCPVTLSHCSGSSTPVDQVGLMVFPGLCSLTTGGLTTTTCNNSTNLLPAGSALTNTIANPQYASDEYTCPSTMPPLASYNNDPEYLVLPFQSNYRSSDTSPVNFNSPIGKAIGAGNSNCGLSTTGANATEYTFYAGALQAAQDYLTLNNTPGVQNIIIFLSDGDANAPAPPNTAGMAGNVKQLSGPYAGTTFLGTNECQQAVTTANAAKAAGTLIYSISYGSETTGCSTDTTGSTTRTPCATMQGVASPPLSQYFFSVPQTIGGVQSTVCQNAIAITALNQVFTTIAGDLTNSRLVPNVVY